MINKNPIIWYSLLPVSLHTPSSSKAEWLPTHEPALLYNSDDGADYARVISRSITDQPLLLHRSLCVKVRAFGESNDLCVTSVTF